MKLPNGFGSIVKLSGNRRKPYAVRRHGKYLAYFATHDEALIYLADVNKQPDIVGSELTFAEIYRLEMAEHTAKISPKTVNGYKSAYQHCKALCPMKIKDIKVSDLQAVIAECETGQPTQKKVRQIMHNVYRYAVKYQLISASADLSGYVDIDKLKRKYKKVPFNTRQLNRVKKLAESDEPLSCWAQAVVMMIYGGPRTSEFLSILKSDVKLKQRYYIIRDSKTEAGRNRAVPINRKALPYFKLWMDKPGKTLITVDDGAALSYHRFRTRFDNVMDATNCHHTPHECRHTCATMLDNAGANETAVKRILGHASQGVTKGVYTHKSLHELKKAIDMI